MEVPKIPATAIVLIWCLCIVASFYLARKERYDQAQCLNVGSMLLAMIALMIAGIIHNLIKN